MTPKTTQTDDTAPVDALVQTATPAQINAPAPTGTPPPTDSAAQTDTLPFLFPSVSDQPLTWWERTILALYQGDDLPVHEAHEIFTRDNPFTSNSEGLQPLLQVLYDLVHLGLVFDPDKNSPPPGYWSWYSPRLDKTLYWRHEELYFDRRTRDPDYVFYWLRMSRGEEYPKSIIHTCIRPGFATKASTMWLAGADSPARSLVQNSFATKNPIARGFVKSFAGPNGSGWDILTPEVFEELWRRNIDDGYLCGLALDLLLSRVPAWGSEVGITPNWAFMMCHAYPSLLGYAKEWKREKQLSRDPRAIVQEIRVRARDLINGRIVIGPVALAQTSDFPK